MIIILSLISIFVVLLTRFHFTKGSTNNNDIHEPFFQSARIGNMDILLNNYMNKGFDVSSRDSKGNTALIIASGRGQTEVIKTLLDYGANVEESTAIGLFEGKSALSWAASQGRAEAVALLLQSQANQHFPATRGVFLGKTPLHWAASQGHTSVVRLLISSGVDVNYASPIGNFKGKTALMWSASQGRLQTMTFLLEAGANVNDADNDGVTALSWASGSEASKDDNYKKGLMEKPTKGNAEVVKKLLQYGTNVDLRDNDGISPLMYASFHGHFGAVEALLNAGADASFRNKAGKSALHLAQDAGFNEIVELIMNGPTILSLAVNDILQVSTCGWILSVIRAPYGSGVYPNDVTNNRSDYSIDNMCYKLAESGLDTFLGDLLYLVSESSIDEILGQLNFPNFATRVRAKSQLIFLLKKYQNFIGSSFNTSCITNGNYLIKSCK